MNSEEFIVISDEEEDSPNTVETNSNDKPQDDCSSSVCMPEFVSVPSTSSSNMESEIECITNPAKVISPGPCNFIEITKNDMKNSIQKNDVIIKIEGTLNPSNINAIMAVIKLYNFQNTGKFYFVKNSNTNEEINVTRIDDLTCHEKLPDISTLDKKNSVSLTIQSHRLNVFSKSNKVKAQPEVNLKPTTIISKNHEKRKRKINKSNEFTHVPNKLIRAEPIDEIGKASLQNSEPVVRHVDNNHTNENQIFINKLNGVQQSTPNIYGSIRVKPFDQIGITSRQNVDNDHANQNDININKTNGFNKNTQEDFNSSEVIPFNQMGRASHRIIETGREHFDNFTEFHQNQQRGCYKIRLKPFNKISKPSHQVAETAVSIDNTQNDTILQEAQQIKIGNCHQESELDPDVSLLELSKSKYRSINCAPSPTNFNVFSKTQNNSVLQNDPINCEPIQQNPINFGGFSSESDDDSRSSLLKVLKTEDFCDVEEKIQKKDKVEVQNGVKKIKNNLQSFYEKKYKLKEIKIVLSRLEVENYFAGERLQDSKERSSAHVNQIFIHDHNFANMTHYYRDKIPPNTQIYFVNKHNITTSLYMKNFPLFRKAIKSNKIKVISESTYKKYQPTEDEKLISLPNNSVTNLKTRKFCKFVSDFHRSLSLTKNPFLKYIKLDHSYNVTMF